jgi:hypothetical protein
LAKDKRGAVHEDGSSQVNKRREKTLTAEHMRDINPT